ncbi:MAG: CDP-glycerol glycerophosphotransferase family protein [Eubacterium sp.]|nr:CDP-glycerol glycerophosphotransferase family protein [Eubacterium sp.]
MKKELLKIGFKPLTLCNKFIKKDNRLIFFYSNLGFRDNVKAFYDYLIREGYHKEYRIVVSANDYERFEQDAPEGVTFVGTKEGIRYFLKAKYAFFCFGKYPIKPAKKQMVVNLWHGTPLKKIGNLEQGCEKIDYNFFTKVLTTAPMYKPIMASIFGCKESQVEVMGNPRNDEMFVADSLVDTSIRRGSRKVFLWLPTYREYNPDFVISCLSREDLERLNEYLKGVDCRLIIKTHPLQKVEEVVKYPYIDFITEEQLQKQKMTVYTLLRNADALITDYSSVYFDYMLLNRPIAFAVEDMEEYRQKRGFVFDNPKEYMPGMEIKNVADVEIFMADTFNGMDPYKEQREEINHRVNYYQDGDTCERIANRFIR